MSQIIKEITVDVAKKNLFQAIVAKQNDINSRFLKVTLCNDGRKIAVSSDATVIINAERADASSAGFMGNVNADGTVTVPLTSWMLALDDVVKCSISVIDTEEQKLTSTSFSIDVEAAEYSSEDITDDENFDILVRLISECADAKFGCETATDKAESAATAADLAAESANSAAVAANKAAEDANTAADSANTASATANNAADSANKAKSNADKAAEDAVNAAKAANDAALAANNALNTANQAVEAAVTAVSNANDAVSAANMATSSANKAVEDAVHAAQAANNAAAAIEDQLASKADKTEISNPNLLDNWYFADPINQRGQTEYTEIGYTIDRWHMFNGIVTLDKNNGAIVLSKNNTEQVTVFTQKIEDSGFKGKTFSLSVLTADGKLTYDTDTIPIGSEGYDGKNIRISDKCYMDIGFDSTDSTIVFRIILEEGNVDPISFAAVKLELGNRQTLAHQDENGRWILNDPPPNKGQELAKCQRYQVVIPYSSDTGISSVGFFIAGAAEEIEIQYPLPMCPRLKQPTVKLVGTMTAVRYGPGAIAVATVKDVAAKSVRTGANYLQIMIPCDWSGVFERGDYGVADIRTADSYLIIDSNL
ncbi:MAG: BppU family phage baseplate upper protein [Oscillospiraceae bacterium]|nr:BppU family phage baseplate upper protein [Oscillospiraceae bacterium]